MLVSAPRSNMLKDVFEESLSGNSEKGDKIKRLMAGGPVKQPV